MKNRNGYTLVEVLAVISILGIVMVLVLPTVLSVFGNSKKMLSEQEKEILIDAAKYYIIDIDEGVKPFIYQGNNPTTINGKTYSKGQELSVYDARTYLIENDGIIITALDLVNGKYYDKDCIYEGSIVDYKENGVIKTSVAQKDISCTVPKTCKIKIGIVGHKVQNDLYYVVDDYKVELLDGCE